MKIRQQLTNWTRLKFEISGRSDVSTAVLAVVANFEIPIGVSNKNDLFSLITFFGNIEATLLAGYNNSCSKFKCGPTVIKTFIKDLIKQLLECQLNSLA